VLSLTLGSVEEGWADEGDFGRVQLSDALLLEEGVEGIALSAGVGQSVGRRLVNRSEGRPTVSHCVRLPYPHHPRLHYIYIHLCVGHEIRPIRPLREVDGPFEYKTESIHSLGLSYVGLHSNRAQTCDRIRSPD
jgi:hypothetical protein